MQLNAVKPELPKDLLVGETLFKTIADKWGKV